ncbi:MAG: ABC transporter ATP-binding protein [Clostridia bacterium]
MEELLSMHNIELTYHTKDNETLALSDLNLSIYEGEFVCIVGPSGCGKTTILSLITGLLKPTSGTLFVGGKSITKADPLIGYMFQRDHLFDWINVQNNVLLPLKIQHKLTNENINYINILLEKYGLSEFKTHIPSQLSGGMRQRVALIRTLATRPKILLLDEPFSALDYQTRLHVQDDVYKIIKKEQTTAILVTHDIAEAISMSDKIIILTNRPAKVKKIIEVDMPKDITPFQRRELPSFGKYFTEIWEELRDEENKKNS